MNHSSQTIEFFEWLKYDHSLLDYHYNPNDNSIEILFDWIQYHEENDLKYENPLELFNDKEE